MFIPGHSSLTCIMCPWSLNISRKEFYLPVNSNTIKMICVSLGSLFWRVMELRPRRKNLGDHTHKYSVFMKLQREWLVAMENKGRWSEPQTQELGSDSSRIMGNPWHRTNSPACCWKRQLRRGPEHMVSQSVIISGEELISFIPVLCLCRELQKGTAFFWRSQMRIEPTAR